MMKRDFKKFKFVGGAKVENKHCEIKCYKRGVLQSRDNIKRLEKWETTQLTERDLNDWVHGESNSDLLSNKEGKKLFDIQSNQHITESQDLPKKTCIKIIKQKQSECEDEQIYKQPVRTEPAISQQLKNVNDIKHILPHMREDLNNKQIEIDYPKEGFHTFNSDFINQKKHYLPSFQNISEQHYKQPFAQKNESHFKLGFD